MFGVARKVLEAVLGAAVLTALALPNYSHGEDKDYLKLRRMYARRGVFYAEGYEAVRVYEGLKVRFPEKFSIAHKVNEGACFRRLQRGFEPLANSFFPERPITSFILNFNDRREAATTLGRLHETLHYIDSLRDPANYVHQSRYQAEYFVHKNLMVNRRVTNPLHPHALSADEIEVQRVYFETVEAFEDAVRFGVDEGNPELAVKKYLALLDKNYIVSPHHVQIEERMLLGEISRRQSVVTTGEGRFLSLYAKGPRCGPNRLGGLVRVAGKSLEFLPYVFHAYEGYTEHNLGPASGYYGIGATMADFGDLVAAAAHVPFGWAAFAEGGAGPDYHGDGVFNVWDHQDQIRAALGVIEAYNELAGMLPTFHGSMGLRSNKPRVLQSGFFSCTD